ncbi:hypothetical protein OEB99_16690 [Actinotalea sp. M2MS4P-6]|uniref:hypothetical protein n=1 Tax=Actinotalea sp. M2MS4P-6 TaxID=2983762 RepID=UPI0021E38011|nr:hypothetical protein [Actinotalea sp. M2MS4P-6]MCV2395955.1 hypothetical protein [Actinotalea sp. M2MS4P-6]
MTLRAITVKQPWAWAIIHGGKDVENRTRNIAGTYRGLVAIHAGLTDDESDLSSALTRAAWVQWWTEAREAGVDVGPQLGHVLAVAELVDVHEAPPPEVQWCGCSRWAERFFVHHLVLANVRPLPTPVPARGFLSLWTLPDDVEAAVREQVAL